jgi:hypothetical protein
MVERRLRGPGRLRGTEETQWIKKGTEGTWSAERGGGDWRVERK